MSYEPKVYISVPDDANLSPKQILIKQAILSTIRQQGFELQIFHEEGVPRNQLWTFSNANGLMSHCDGAVVLAFAKWQASNPVRGVSADVASEFNHFEGALAVAHDLPTLIVVFDGLSNAGITNLGGGKVVSLWDNQHGPDWVTSNKFSSDLAVWVKEIRDRRKVFLGYCSSATNLADSVQNYLNQVPMVSVVNYASHFVPGNTILGQIEKYEKESVAGIFLFTKDDELLVGNELSASPRDNVIFEAGYFTHAKGKERVLIIREEGAKMPADLGGVIYISLKDRNDIQPILPQIQLFLDANL